jgi:hypothetical protein
MNTELPYGYILQQLGESHPQGEINVPALRDLADDVEQGFLTEAQRVQLEQRQAQTGNALKDILAGRFGL